MRLEPQGQHRPFRLQRRGGLEHSSLRVAASLIKHGGAQVLRGTDVRLDGHVEEVHVLDLIEAPGLRR